MAYSVYVGTSADREYNGAMAYLAEEYASPHAMRTLADAYDAAIDALAANPYAYPVDFDMSEAVGREIRKISAGHYLLRYSIDDKTRMVKVYSMLHMRQDARRHFPADFIADE